MRLWTLFLKLIGDVAPAILLVVVVVVVSADVVGRTVFLMPVYAANEISVIAFIWLVWLGAIGVARRGEMMGVRFFVEWAFGNTRWVDFAVDLLIVAICAVVIRASIVQIRTARFASFDLLGLPRWVLVLGVLICMSVLALVHLHRALACVLAALRAR